jgi:D-arabinose 1-dehydrogenase-like Zn-dependent alcohol dehydrogenase
MTHIAIQEARDGKVVDWMERVTDEQYAGLVIMPFANSDGACTFCKEGLHTACRTATAP